MTFKDLKQNGILYILDIKDVSIQQGVAEDVSLPHVDTHYMTPNELVIDITVGIDGHKISYTMKENSEVCYAGNKMITPNKDSVLKEVQNIKIRYENLLNQVDYYKEVINKCSGLLKEYDPEFRDKQERDARIASLEETIKQLQESIKVLVDKEK